MLFPNVYPDSKFQLRFKAGVQASPALQAKLALQKTKELLLGYLRNSINYANY